MKDDRLGTTASRVCEIMFNDGFTFKEIESYLQNATHTNGYFYIDEIPTKN